MKNFTGRKSLFFSEHILDHRFFREIDSPVSNASEQENENQIRCKTKILETYGQWTGRKSLFLCVFVQF